MSLMGLRAPAPISGAAGLVTGVASWLLGGHSDVRDVWECPGRLHIETHGVHGPGGARVARRVERTLQGHPGVLWARVNAPACRVVVALADPPPPHRELVALVEQAESAPINVDEEIAEEELHHPAEGPGRTRALPNLAVDTAALALSGLTRLAPWAPLPTELAGLLSAASLHPRLREVAADHLHGQERAESLVSMAAGLAHALAAGGSGVVLDVAQRIGQWQEARACQQAWQEAEPRFIRGPEDAGADPVVVERPRRLPDGPVERYQRRVLAFGAAAVPAATPVVGWRRAAAVGLATLPKATEAGRAAFASHLGTVLARSGALVMDRAALRLLGRLDTLMLDEVALRSNRWELTDLIPLAGVDAGEVAERRSMLYEGTTLAAGRAVAIVVATGADTEVGRSMAAARQSAPTTGVEVHLRRFTRRSLPVALGSGAAVVGAGLLHGTSVRESLGAAVNLAIASVPEGLPFLVNAAQLAAARRLADLGALVRNPRTIEALGRVDVLCFDKTGTLTEGRLAVREVHDGAHGCPPQSLNDQCRAVVAAALRASPDARHPQDLAHRTDRAVVECARRARIRPGTGHRGWHKVLVLPFEPSRGFHATIGRSGKNILLSVKGAPEVVLSRCRRRRLNGHERDMTDRERAAMTALAERLAGAGHRVLAVAERRTAITPDEVDDNAVRDLVFLGFLALADPVRTSAAPAAERLREAGVQTVMITGDHPATADAIAATMHPDGKPNQIITGAEIDRLDDDALDRRLPEVDVIARCSPAQKVRIIQAYQRMGKVVAMTGDGANDAAAIRLADVGIALGRRGTPAAQAAADLVVSDDRLETIIEALVEGRAMWSSVRHAMGILLGGNLGEIAFTVLGTALTGRSPLNARQLLLVNLLTDLAPALAIALRPPSRYDVAHLLREGPDISLGEPLTQEMTTRALATTAGAGSAWLAARLTGGSRRASTVALAALVGTQLGQTLLTGGLDRNVLTAGLSSAALLAAVIQTPIVSGFFGCTPLGPVGWSIAFGSATAGSILGAALSRWTPAILIPEPSTE
ncbi:HAD-IC family P-type ATPase [Nonomuraea sp. 3N208]|uniref:HAD-IC family P-type ATPase n=1 Tax=Nonomuraea sp. 3N208 TaxID=3457421 RepID=UPI003FCC76D7